MGWSPSVIIVVRHGARLDAADKQWHLTSPTPYDPPLTYGGWTQSKALGTRIANILRTRETDDEELLADGNVLDGEHRRKRRHKVVIHSSPFLRCVQTSIGISAGLAQNPGHSSVPTRSSSPAINAAQSSPRVQPISTGSPAALPLSDSGSSISDNPEIQQGNIRKSTVRVDAFLGEWLCPDYFDQITPPPSSIMMIAGAKADLLRKEDLSQLVKVREVSANQPFPGGWGSPVVSPTKDKHESGLASLAALSASLPRERTSSLNSTVTYGTRISHVPSHLQVQIPGSYTAYQPPIPSYPISNSDSVPSGYVAHARDACVDVDYQWDSMREPQEWGNGGEYGEEWSQMHKRFRSGLQSMLGWYDCSDDPAKLLTKAGSRAVTPDGDTSDVDTDLVLVLVTHGAGCNALVGALTNQPVLVDVGMASLTMAVKRDIPLSPSATSPPATPLTHSRASSRNTTISDQYDVKLVANTEHLRTSSNSTPSSARNSVFTSMFRDRFGNATVFDGVTRPASANSNLGSIRRTASVTSSTPPKYAPHKTSSIGLWSASRPKTPEPEPEEDNMILNFQNDNTGDTKLQEVQPPTAAIDIKENQRTPIPEDQQDGETDLVAPLGLWGMSHAAGMTERVRDVAMKRRWTVNDHRG